jgi:hypothetical protein
LVLGGTEFKHVRKRILTWVDGEGIWHRLYKGGELFPLLDVSTQTGIGVEDLKEAFRYGFEVRKDGRFQHLCYIPEDYVGCDSEETARTCMREWLMKNGYEVYGSPLGEVGFDVEGLTAICRCAESGKVEDWYALRSHVRKNGIDLVAFSHSTRRLWIVELKGWTSTSSDFNETIHQIFRRIDDIYKCCQLPPNIRFACAFPYFWKVREWTKKFAALNSITQNSGELLANFGSATTVKEEKGNRFMAKFVQGPLDVAVLMKNRKLLFVAIISLNEVRDILTSTSIMNP